MLKQRVITAVILALVFVVSIVFNWVHLLFAVGLAVAIYELSTLTLRPGIAVSITFGVVLGGMFWWTNAQIGETIIYYQSLLGAMFWAGILLYLFIYRYSGNLNVVIRVSLFLLVAMLLWVCAHSLLFLFRSFDEGGWILLYMLTLVWIADIGAYFSGRRFGKNKLAPRISPGKTWEGVAGGIIANFLWILLIYHFSNGWGMSFIWFILAGLATSVISVVGDLFESILKREAGAKDSSKLLPGHGGVLDRIDSVIAASPVFLSAVFLAGLV